MTSAQGDPAGRVAAGLTEEACPEEAFRLGRVYFTRLDLQVNPGFCPMDPGMVATLTAFRDVLKRRLFLRRDAIRDGGGPPLLGFDVQVIQRLSTLMLELMESVFGSGFLAAGVLEVVGRAHDLFASGRLRRRCDPRIRVPNNVPDGAAIFLYPEFALLAIEQGVDPAAWTALLPILVRMSAIYLKVHEEHPVERRRLPRLYDEYREPPETGLAPRDLEFQVERLKTVLSGASPAKSAQALGALALRALTDP